MSVEFMDIPFCCIIIMKNIVILKLFQSTNTGLVKSVKNGKIYYIKKGVLQSVMGIAYHRCKKLYDTAGGELGDC